MPSNKLYIYHHLGLGDHFNCNGMVRYILKHGFQDQKYDQIIVFSKNSYYNIIQHMYRDEDNIIVIKISDTNENQNVVNIVNNDLTGKLLKVGHEYFHSMSQEFKSSKNCWEAFYEQVQIPYNIRYQYFYVQRDLDQENQLYNQLNPQNVPYIFIHDDPQRGFFINRKHLSNLNLYIIENDITINPFYFIKIIEHAEEIHCMESCFKILVDMYAKQNKLFFHDCRPGDQPLGKRSLPQWKVVQYD